MNKSLHIALNVLATFLASAAGTYLAECFYWKKPFGNRVPSYMNELYDPAMDENWD